MLDKDVGDARKVEDQGDKEAGNDNDGTANEGD